MWLAIETSGGLGSVAVGPPGGLVAETTAGVRARHSESLLPVVEELFVRAGIEAAALKGVVIGAGPGSYTGLRIGASAAKGLVHALGIPLRAYATPLVIAAGLPEERTVCVLTTLRRGEAAVACYERNGSAPRTVLAPTSLPLDDAIERALSLDPLFAAEPGTEARERIAAMGLRLAPAPLCVARAALLLWLAGEDPAGGAVDDWQTWEPDYLGGWGAR